MLDPDALRTYLDDHLAGAQTALGLVERLENDPVEGLDFEALGREIEEDRQVVLRLLEEWDEEPSSVKRAAGWLAGQLSRPKLPDDAALGRFETLELLSLGILGKRALWRTLATVRAGEPRLAALDLARLEARAVEQHERVERARLASAPRAFRADPERAAAERRG